VADIAHSLAAVEDRIAEAAGRSGREPGDVTLVAISKMFPAQAVVEAYQAGVRHFGENRVYEGLDKMARVDEVLAAPDLTWHMVGHIQSRKAEDVVGAYRVVHSVDRLKIARYLSRYAQAANLSLPVLLECNVSGETSKYGFDLSRWAEEPPRRQAFREVVRKMINLPGIELQGLMTMAPLVDDPEEARPVFASLRGLRDWLNEQLPNQEWRHLSMGMTNDFEVAVEEGATMVRVGRAVFGPREH